MVHGLIFKLLFSFVICISLLHSKQKDIYPFLMPENHPIKKQLDSLFSSSKGVLNSDLLEKLGFKKSKPRRFTKIIVTSHSSFPGYIFKLYLDTQRYHKDYSESYYWVLRCTGAQKIRHFIAQNHLQSIFKVPQKWIYILPKKSKKLKGYYPKESILVEEDMNILRNDENKEAWKSNLVNTHLLFSLYRILKDIGLNDCTKPDNIPFSKDGKVAFIDTQSFNQKVSFSRLSKHLSKQNKSFWESLIQYD